MLTAGSGDPRGQPADGQDRGKRCASVEERAARAVAGRAEKGEESRAGRKKKMVGGRGVVEGGGWRFTKGPLLS